MALLVLVGLLSILSQVALLRELLVALYGVELVVPLAFAVWMLSTAAGAGAGFRLKEPPISLFGPVLVLTALVIPGEAAVLRASRLLFRGVLGAYLPLTSQVALLFLALAPPGFLLGLLFQWAAKRYVSRGRTLALAYSIESAGCLAGGLASTLLAAAGVQNFAILLGTGALAAAGALGLPSGGARRAVRGASAVLFGGLLAASLGASGVDRKMTSWNHPHLVDARDTPYGRATVTKNEDLIAVYENNALAFETEGTAAEELAHLAAIQHPRPKRILLLGGGLSGLVGELLKHAPERLDVVEVNRQLATLVRPYLPPGIREPLEAPAVQWVFEDPRRFLARTGAYDLIVVGMPEPSSGQANRFYTREFFDLCASRLSEGGVVAFRLSSAENYLPPPLARRLSSIAAAARASLPHLVVLPGTTNIIFASKAPLPREPAALETRLEERKIEARLVTGRYVRYLYTNDRFEEIAKLIDATSAPVNTDAEPFCYQYTVLAWLSMFIPVSWLFEASSDLRRAATEGSLRWILPGALAAAFLAARVSPWLRRALLAAVAGFAGMTIETVALLQYQVKSGILYQDIGLLLTMFMAGLSVGAFAIDRLAQSARGPRRTWGLGLLLAFATVSGISALGVRAGGLAGLLEASAILFASGALVSSLFAYAALYGVEDQRAAVSPLYAADLAGGCLAAIATSLVSIPVLGIPWTAAATGVTALAAALLL